MSYAGWRDEIAKAINPALHPIEWLDWRVENGSVMIWENEGGIILAEIRQFPSGATEVHGVVAAGKLEAIAELIPLAEAWGREQGCIRASISSFPAWGRYLKTRGYAPAQLTVAKEL